MHLLISAAIIRALVEILLVHFIAILILVKKFVVDYVILVRVQHHFLVLILSSLVVPAIRHSIIFLLCLRIIVGILVLELLQFVCVRCSNELSVHVEYLTLWIHQELSFISFNLDPPHDNIVLHVHANLLICCLHSVVLCLPRLSIIIILWVDAIIIECALRIIVVELMILLWCALIIQV